MSERGFTSNHINEISNLLWDRYKNGFPVLKEIIQNADDARAERFVFGRHPGFPDANYRLLQGPGIWFFNNGDFTEKDARGIGSFNISHKTGDSATIGNFGLGMKSVFHLCEAMIYAARDVQGKDHSEVITPWQSEENKRDLGWRKPSRDDWRRLQRLAGKIEEGADKKASFLLWLPLRSKSEPSSQEKPVIIKKFPADNEKELAFLKDDSLPCDIAQMLPLLRNLKLVEHREKDRGFVLQLSGDERLMAKPASQGKVLIDGKPLLSFSGRRRRSDDSDFARIKQHEGWPERRARDEKGYEVPKKDKAEAEAAALFCSGGSIKGNLQWAVFLPVEEEEEKSFAKADEHGQAHSLVLHGQFFLDSGRKNIRGLEDLHNDPGEINDYDSLTRVWNRRLAQEVLCPLVLPTLQDHCTLISDEACRSLTKAMSRSGWFKKFQKHLCRNCAWVRVLEESGPRWKLVEGTDLPRLRPFPGLPASGLNNLQEAFPGLAKLDLILYDKDEDTQLLCKSTAPPGEWTKDDLEKLLSHDFAGIFTISPANDCVRTFLCDQKKLLCADNIQRRLVDILRKNFADSELPGKDQAEEFLGLLEPDRKIRLTAKLPEPLRRKLWGIDAPVLLVPGSLASSSPNASLNPLIDENYLVAWFKELDRVFDSPDDNNCHRAALEAMQQLLPLCNYRQHFLEEHKFRAIKAVDAASGVSKPVSLSHLKPLAEKERLFVVSQPDSTDNAASLLARVTPKEDVRLITKIDESLFPDKCFPEANDIGACLSILGRRGGHLGDIDARKNFLRKIVASNIGWTDVTYRRGLRFLLHGQDEHLDDDSSCLWIEGHRQHSAWKKLWESLNTDEWSLIDKKLACIIPSVLWEEINICLIEHEDLIDNLHKPDGTINNPENLDREERDEILSHIEDEQLWRQLPLHTTVKGELVRASAESPRCCLPSAKWDSHQLSRGVVLIDRSDNEKARNRQEEHLQSLDDPLFRIEVALDKSPCDWRTIMDAMCDIEGLPGKLAEQPWLPTSSRGTAVAPEKIIDLPDSLGAEVGRLVGQHQELNESTSFATPDELTDEVRSHEAYQRLHKFFLPEINVIESLAELLKNLPEYRIGEWAEQPSGEQMQLLAHHDGFPGWRLLEALCASDSFDPENVWDGLASVLAKGIEPERLSEILNWISRSTEGWRVRKDVHDVFLRQLAEHDRHGISLRGLKLASQASDWQAAEKLCVEAHGIAPICLLDKNQQDILADLICSSDAADEAEANDREASAGEAAKVLNGYFANWKGNVPDPMIGVIMGLLGGNVHNLAEEFLRPHSFKWLIDHLKLEKNDLARYAVSKIYVVDDEETREVSNILGERIRVDLASQKNVYNLISGQIQKPSDSTVVIALRRIRPDQFSSEKLYGILRSTAESICRALHPEQKPDFESLWAELAESDQLDIKTACVLIQESIPFYLRLLPVKDEQIRKLLNEYHSLQCEIVERRSGSNARKVKEEMLIEKRNELAASITKKPEIQAAIVQALKRKLDDYQYNTASIPMELFQNADDAAVELGKYHESGGIPASARHFAICKRRGGIAFLHWGREINACGPVEFEGREQGFGRDLEKMLILSATDKPDNESITGKFGLGFKSVLIACDQPRIISGRMAIRVVAGILPQHWNDDDAKQARRRLYDWSSPGSGTTGTLIDLPLADESRRKEIIDHFEKHAGILCVFGKAIRHIDSGEDSPALHWSWKPEKIFPNIENIEIGELHLHGESRSQALCIRTTDAGSLLIALGPKGFRKLSVAPIWVTTPTQGSSPVGFAINGNFDLDAGRGRLAGSSEKNLAKAEMIGKDAGKALGGLLEESWETMRSRLKLRADAEEVDFWESIWHGLTEKCIEESRSVDQDLVDKTVACLLGQLRQAVPNGLPGKWRALTPADSIAHELPDSLTSEDALAILLEWSRFADRHPVGTCVSRKTGRILRKFLTIDLQTISIADLVGLLDGGRVKKDDADALGRLRCLPQGGGLFRVAELGQLLGSLRFCSAAGWKQVRELMRGSPECCLNDDYSEPAKEFFRFCRQQSDSYGLASYQLPTSVQDVSMHERWSQPDQLPIELNKLSEQWTADKARKYRCRLYPDGFEGMHLHTVPEDEKSRSSWMILLALGCFQSMGLTNEAQHQSFINLCQQKGWWSRILADTAKEDDKMWFEIMKEYLEDQTDDEKWKPWFVGQLLNLYKLRRWLDNYAAAFLSINDYGCSFNRAEILALRTNPRFQGTDIDAPPLTRTLNIGYHLIIRELLHHKAITNPHAVAHAYAPIERIKKFFSEQSGQDASFFTYKKIYETLAENLGEEKAVFNGDYDIPLRVISSKDGRELFNIITVGSDV